MYRDSKDHFGAFIGLAIGVTLAIFGFHFVQPEMDITDNFISVTVFGSGLVVIFLAISAMVSQPEEYSIDGVTRSKSLPDRRQGPRRSRSERRLPNLPRMIGKRRRVNRRQGRDRRLPICA